MATADLDALYLLHRVDAQIAEIRDRAANLDIGQEERAQLAKLEPLYQAEKQRLEALRAEQKDCELKRSGLEAKIKETDALVYSGKVTSPKEIDAYQKEIAMWKRQVDELETQQLELMESLPQAEAEYKKLDAPAQALRKSIQSKIDLAKEMKPKLEAAFKEAQSKRAPLAAKIPPNLLQQYDMIRQKSGGIGMAEITANGACQRCGTTLPSKAIIDAREGRVMTCETCHRILVAMV